MMRRTTMMLALLTTVACTEPPRPAGRRCEVRDDEGTQALIVLPRTLDVVLDGDLGGLTCTSVSGQDCGPVFERDCIGSLDAVVGAPLEVTVTLRSEHYQATIDRVVVESDCGWSLDDETGFLVDPGNEVSLKIAFVGESVGACGGRLDIFTTDTVGEPVALPVTLRATVTAD